MSAATSMPSFEAARQLLQQAQGKQTDGIPLPPLPPAPNSIAECGLSASFLCDLVLKTFFARGQIRGIDLSNATRLPYPGILEAAIRLLRDESLVEVRKGQDYQELNWEFALTGKGQRRADDVMAREGYVGPAPVPLSVYNQTVRNQPAQWSRITDESLRSALADIVIANETIQKLGPAFNSGKSMFLYGHAGNGKTSVSERMARILMGGYLLPFAIEVYGQVIRLFDSANHHVLVDPLAAPGNLTAPDGTSRFDQRWLIVRRPFIVVGGELKREHLNLTYDPIMKYYVAPVQLKANGGILLIDDFGRQEVPPKDLLNRWIVPLDRNLDYHTLITGQQVEVPFQVLIIFSTNLDPRDLVDEAFLRRLRYKIEIGDPTEEEFREIFRRCCATMQVPFAPAALDHLVEEHYHRSNRGFRAVHPRDLMTQALDLASYRGWERRLTPELIDAAVGTYFVEL